MNLAAFALACTLLADPAPAQKSVNAAESAPRARPKLVLHAIEQNVIDRVNAERRRHGLRPLAIDRRLVESARRHASWMTHNQRLVHTSQPVAENIAMGQSSSHEVVRDWMNSPGHRANILGSYRRVGAAAYRSKGGAVYWCLQLLR